MADKPVIWTEDDYVALCKAIATGAQMVMYGNKQVMYKGTEDMLRVKREMERELGYTSSTSRKKAQFSKGI
jgi:hypothetical protein